MEKDQLTRKLAVILHADVVGSTGLVRLDEAIAHNRIQAAFNEFSRTIDSYGGIAHEIRGDALVAEFERASDAVAASIAFQETNEEANRLIEDNIRPKVRIGISLGEVIIENNTVTGAGVVLAQRLEQMANPDGVVVQGAVSETVPDRLPFEFNNLGEHQLKGFDQPIRAFGVELKAGFSVPGPEHPSEGSRTNQTLRVKKSLPVILVLASLVAIGIGTYLALSTLLTPDALELPSGPKIAVLSFSNLDDPEDKKFGRQLTEDIINALSKFDFFVFPPITTRQFEGQDCRSIADSIKADRILEGTVRRSDNRLRVSARFLDTIDCSLLWTETYDEELTASNIFAVQDRISNRVSANVGSLGAFLWSDKKMREIREKGPNNLDVYECWVLIQAWYIDFSEEPHRLGTECFEKAVELEPDYWRSHAGLGWAYMEARKYFYGHYPPDGMDRALFHLRKAIELNPRGQDGYYGLAMHQLYANCNWEAFQRDAESAIAINPNNARALAELGTYLWASGLRERGKAMVSKALALTPRHPRWFRWVFFSDHFANQEFEMARDLMVELDLRNNYLAQAQLASTYGHLGELDKARETIENVVRLNPEFAKDPRKPFKIRCNSEDSINLVMEGLKKAGFSEPSEQP